MCSVWSVECGVCIVRFVDCVFSVECGVWSVYCKVC